MLDPATSNDTLADFLRRKRNEVSSTDIDWETKKQGWVSSLNALYRHLTDDLLKDLISDNTIQVSETTKQVTEEFIGTYTVPELRLRIGAAQVVFSPKGVNVIGAAGRIDLRGDRDTVTLIRQKAHDNNSEQWKIVSQRIPTVVTRQLDSDSLKWALEHVML